MFEAAGRPVSRDLRDCAGGAHLNFPLFRNVRGDAPATRSRGAEESHRPLLASAERHSAYFADAAYSLRRPPPSTLPSLGAAPAACCWPPGLVRQKPPPHRNRRTRRPSRAGRRLFDALSRSPSSTCAPAACERAGRRSPTISFTGWRATAAVLGRADFVPRADYGRYLQDLLAEVSEAIRRPPQGRHRRRPSPIHDQRDGVELEITGSGRLHARKPSLPPDTDRRQPTRRLSRHPGVRTPS